jgi:hypothetical protein
MKITDIITEAASPAQQAAIAISMKKAGKKPRSVDEDLTRRGFLRGLGAAAVAGAAGSALAGTDDLDFPNKVQKMHSDMMEKNPRYAKEHEALGIALARGFVGAAAENNKRWYQKTAELLQKYGVKVNEGVAEGDDDHIWGSQGRFAGDTHVNVGGDVMNMIQVGDVVKYFGQKAEVVAMSKDRKRARITRGGITQDVNTSDLTQLGQGMAEESSENKYSNLSNRGVNRGINRAGDDFNRMLDLDQAESPHYKTQHQQDTKQRLKTKPMPGPKGVLPEQDLAESKELAEEFDLIESIVEQIAEHNGVDAEAVWEDLESLTEDELYVFAVTSDPLMEDWQKANKRDKTDGMSQKAVNAYRRENPGSKLKTAVTTKPGKLKKGGKASKRRKSYCSRSRGQMKMHSISCAKTPDKAICKARRRWNC